LPNGAISAEALDVVLKKLNELLEVVDQDELEALRSQFESHRAGGREALSLYFEAAYLRSKEKKEAVKAQQVAGAVATSNSTFKSPPKVVKAPWSPKELQILTKAVNLFPGGSVDRWEKIADYVTAHGGSEDESPEQLASRQRSSEECVKMSKSVLLSGGLPNAATARAVLQNQAASKKPPVEIKDAPTERFDESIPVLVSSTDGSDTASFVSNISNSNAPVVSKMWSLAQQAALEAAMKKYTASMFTGNPGKRWERVAGEVEGKSVKEVRNRIKELAIKVRK
jgi:DnaJ family protein C protein 2